MTATRSLLAAIRCCGPCVPAPASKWIIRFLKKKKPRARNLRQDGSSNREPAAEENAERERAFVPKGRGEKNGSRRGLKHFAARRVEGARVVHDLHRGFVENL